MTELLDSQLSTILQRRRDRAEARASMECFEPTRPVYLFSAEDSHILSVKASLKVRYVFYSLCYPLMYVYVYVCMSDSLS